MKLRVVLIFLVLKFVCVSCDDAIKLDFHLRNPEDIPPPSPSRIDVGFILSKVGPSNQNEKAEKLLRKFSLMLDSMLTFSVGTPLRFLILTEQESVSVISDLLARRLGRHLSHTVINAGPITSRELHYTFPSITTVFVDIDTIIARHAKKINYMKNYYGRISEDGKTVREVSKVYKGQHVDQIHLNTKYYNDLFYILPFYHTEFPKHINKLVFIDIDLEFFTDISKLFQEFSNFKKSQVIGVGITMTPLYLKFTKHLRKKFPDSEFGNPGRYQGLNTGVVLLDLERMRESNTFINATTDQTMHYLHHKYNFVGSVGDQDWLTLVSFEWPELVYILPCVFNVDEHRPGECHNDSVHEWEVVNKAYHDCPDPPLIRHRAGYI